MHKNGRIDIHQLLGPVLSLAISSKGQEGGKTQMSSCLNMLHYVQSDGLQLVVLDPQERFFKSALKECLFV